MSLQQQKLGGLGFNQGWKWKAAPRSLHREQPKWQTAMRWKISKIGASHKFIWGKQITAFHKKIWNKKVFPSGWLASSLSYFFCWLCKPFLTQQMTLQKKYSIDDFTKPFFASMNDFGKSFNVLVQDIAYCIIILTSNMCILPDQDILHNNSKIKHV